MNLAEAPALSVRQPWAELILRGEKTIEVRTWSTSHRGPLWLHTGASRDKGFPGIERFGELFQGGYVGVIAVAAVVSLDPSKWEKWSSKHLSLGAYKPGTFGWLLKTPQRLVAPVPGLGQVGLFYPDAETLAMLLQAI